MKDRVPEYTIEDLVEIMTGQQLTVEQAWPHEIALDEKVRKPAPHEQLPLPENFKSEAWQRRYGGRKR